MPKLILRCNYLKNAPPSHLANYMNYIGTREGVEKVDSTMSLLPATVKQKELIQIGQFAPCPHGAALHRAPLVKVDDLHRRISGRLREGAKVNGPLGGIVAVILRWLPAPGALLHLKQLFVIINALGKVLFRYLAVAVIMAPIIVTLAVLRFGKLPCDKGARGRLVIAQGKAPAIVEGNGFQNLIALVDFYVVSSFPASGQVGPKCMNVTKYPVEPGRKVLGYSGPENRREKA